MSLNKDNAPLRPSRRANGSLLSLDRTPQSQGEDFFTDSLLDASKIPTPSPKKQPFHKAYKERRAIGNSRALKSARQSGPRGSFSDSEGTNSLVHHLRPRKLPSPGRTPTPLRQIDGTNTPPPEISPTSPSIVSSPAHGLDDTYKRIAEEEAIAAQEGELGDEGEYTDEMYHHDAYGESFHPDDESQTGDQNFESDNAFDLEREKENVPLEDGTAQTQVSGISFLDGLTDQNLAAKLTPHAVQAAKDRAFLEKATQRQTPINFKSNKNGPTLSERLQRRSTTEVDESLRHEEPAQPSGAVDDFREPSPNVPKSWARQRTGRDWMHRSRQRREQGRNGALSSPGVDSSQVDWAAAAAADVALPSVEDSSTPKATASRNSSPGSLHSQGSLDRVRQWELNDFTGQSLQVSDSPPVRPRTSVADQRQQREIERLEKQAVTTSRLGQYRKRDPNELIKILSRERSPTTGPAISAYPTPEPSATPPPPVSHLPSTMIATPSASAQKLKGAKFVEEGEPIPNTPVIVYKSSSSSSNSGSNQETRPDNSRKASEDRLARLARAMSHSPKSSTAPEEQFVLETTREAEDGDIPGAEGEGIVAHDTLIDRVVEENMEQAKQAESTRQSSKQLMDSETTPKANKVVDTAKTPKVTGAWTDTILPDTVLRTIRKQEERPNHAQTPHVGAGGWIETPLPKGKRQSSALAPIPIEEEEEGPVPEGLTNGISKPREEAKKDEASEPKKQPQAEAPKSALTSLLARAKSRLINSDGQIAGESNDTLHLNDSTINSLEDLLSLDNAELTTLIRMGAESEAREQLIRDHLGAEPIAEAELLERLGGKLERLRTNIHDARKGISKLEHQVSSEPSSTAVSLKRPGVCTTCGSPPYLIAINLPFPIPHLYHTPKSGLYLPRPTWLGWLTILAWLWYFSEQAMACVYSHPLYTDHSYAWPSEPEPSFPLVLPTMVWRWSGRRVIPTLLGPFWWLLVAIVRVIGQALGWTDGFVDDGSMSTHVLSVGQALAGLEDVVGMGGDEFI
jgi:hypothetical protein